MTSFIDLIIATKPGLSLNINLALREVISWSLSLTSICCFSALVECIIRYNGINRSYFLENHLVVRGVGRRSLASRLALRSALHVVYPEILI